MKKSIKIEVVYALPERQYILKIKLKRNSTVKDAIINSKILEICKDINLNKNKIGIFNKETHLLNKVKEGDRIEIYRLLTFSAKDLREKRLKKKYIL